MNIEMLIQSNTLDIAKKTTLNLILTNVQMAEKFNEILKEFDISAEQFNVLRILRGQKGQPANMCLIQERMVAKTSNTTRLVDKLLLKGLVTRDICPDNRRKMNVMITNKGLEMLLELDPKVMEHEQQFANQLSYDELIELNRLMEKLRG
ncbi:MarR family transcriptional regulator [Flavobacterium branchiophilum NBRC 15030 = ATCC 35035]|uniref:MarR family transcriptional regulator n=2 Tax=Flavobacterium branchiophilum TaxID=55197 RepID=A0A2H3KD59_9FLAO|nr:MarR family transcriptional regulator [Flavobacterium branchiophilum]OXA71565.1 MarR family transcriptional regulator [Flavobacterium branchiophilum NBRC 15030 = ATCC 35035]PDS25502.1 MarR family transcriptional regulator [Flavobacterium branchiophilum]TQM41084.1 MarR family transcriptional regulator [Flavobacterium branchiophilum]CCB68706.1 Probable transcriptional regulator, MarR-family [Flavobacterium branchiophilum FL-15]GEM56496.1 MarR family transcriptional regulator [Flavobacterium b